MTVAFETARSSAKSCRVGIIGGGVAGATLAAQLAHTGELNVTLIEKSSLLVSATPFCHLHSGGFLYILDISEKEALTLLHHSLNFASTFPQCLAMRPTVIALRRDCSASPNQIVLRCKAMQNGYKNYLSIGGKNILGDPREFYQVYTRDNIIALRDGQYTKLSRHDTYMERFAKLINLDSIQYPVVSVQEPGVAMVRVAAALELTLSKNMNDEANNLCVFKDTKVVKIERTKESNYQVHAISSSSQNFQFTFDYLVNAAGSARPEIDVMLADCQPSAGLAEIKASYLLKIKNECEIVASGQKMPEIALLGERGSPQGMIQITPYGEGLYQVHAMAKDATLFVDGLVPCDPLPNFVPHLQHLADGGFDEDTIADRAEAATRHVAAFLPSFSNAVNCNLALWGVQLIPGRNADCRASEAEFPQPGYARMNIVKAISAVASARMVQDDIFRHFSVQRESPEKASLQMAGKSVVVSTPKLLRRAEEMARARGMPTEFATVGWCG